MARLFRNPFRSKRPAPAASPTVKELVAQATVAYASGDFVRAIPIYDKVIALRPDHAEAHYKRGNALKDLGRFDAALASYDAAVRYDPDFGYAWCNRGVILQSLSRYEAALASYDRAIALDSADAHAHTNRGSLLQTLSRWDGALASYDRALELDPRQAGTWFHRGNVLRALRRLDAASASYAQAVTLKPDLCEAHYNRGVLLEHTHQARAALASYDRAIAINPQLHQAHFNRAGVLKGLKELESALAGYDRAIAAKADYAEAHSNRGAVLQELGRWADALASYDRSITIMPGHAAGHFNRGNLLAASCRWDEALASYDRAIALDPGYAAAHCERGRVLMEVKQPMEAISSFSRAVALQPQFAEAQYNMSLALLLCGDYAGGWMQHEWRWKNAERLSLNEEQARTQPLWLGAESPAGKTVLLYCEQGLGDTLQFCRFVKSVAALGATVILEVQAPLASLLAGLEGVSRVVVAGSLPPDIDYRCPLMSLPLALNTTLGTIPAASGYLCGDTAQVARWRGRLENRVGPRIGLAWSGNPRHGNDHRRSVPLADWAGTLPREFQYICVQKEIRPADQAFLAGNSWIGRFDDELQNFGDTAALCESLDLVISVDTSVAHLCGALGRPTWIMLAYNPDWRWLLDREDSPWYETARLYRQPAIGAWHEVFGRITADLRKAFA